MAWISSLPPISKKTNRPDRCQTCEPARTVLGAYSDDRDPGADQMLVEPRDESGGHVDAGAGNVLSRAAKFLQLRSPIYELN